jgi:hypothetical protein
MNVHWAGRLYRAEGGSPYLGIVAAGALVGLLVLTVAGLLRRPARAPHPAAVAIAWVLAYSVLGGVNQLLGAFGFVWLRGTNRFSIWILAVAFLVTRRFARRGGRAVLAALVVAIAVADQVPPRRGSPGIRKTALAVTGDRAFVTAVESALPEGAMLFMLPLVEFPEGRAVLGAREYDHLRPYLHARGLRFSFGTDKGRPREAWQLATVARGPSQMLADLERYGFAGILVDRRAYPHDAGELLAELRAAGRPATIAHAAGDYVLVPLRPASRPVLPGGAETLEP